MDGATNSVVLKTFHLKAFVDDALASHSCISVNHDWNDFASIFLLASQEVLLSPTSPLHARVHSLEMRWISEQSQLDLVTRISVSSAESCAQVIFYITSARSNRFFALLWLNSLELGHDDLHRLAHDICECVEPTSVSHSNDKCARTFLDRGVNAELEARHKGFAALQSKPLHRVEFARHKRAPLMRPIQSLVHVHFLSFGLGRELKRLELLSNPVTHFTVLDVHELDTNLATIGMLISLNELSQLPFLLSLNYSAAKGHCDGEFAFHVRLCESIARWVKQAQKLLVREAELFGKSWTIFVDFPHLERVNIRNQVSVRHEGSQEHLNSSQVVSSSR